MRTTISIVLITSFVWVYFGMAIYIFGIKDGLLVLAGTLVAMFLGGMMLIDQ